MGTNLGHILGEMCNIEKGKFTLYSEGQFFPIVADDKLLEDAYDGCRVFIITQLVMDDKAVVIKAVDIKYGPKTEPRMPYAG